VMKKSCPFCSTLASDLVAENLHALARRDLYPLTEGHTLVVPREHVRSVFDLPPEGQQAVWRLVAEVRDQLLRMEGVEGVNVGINDGEAAGQTVAHAHVHVIPRRKGDVPDPRGGIRRIIPERARYWEDEE
jgi:diadenosine tetraphosphate (Ap4A) HIT family hydrolase